MVDGGLEGRPGPYPYPYIGIGWRETLRLTFVRTSRMEAIERPRIEGEGVIRIEEGVRARTMMRGPGKRRLNRPRLTLVLTRERLVLYTRWRRSVDVRLDDPAWPTVQASIDDTSRLHLLVPRGAGGGVHRSFEMDVRLKVANATGWVREIEAMGGATG